MNFHSLLLQVWTLCWSTHIYFRKCQLTFNGTYAQMFIFCINRLLYYTILLYYTVILLFISDDLLMITMDATQWFSVNGPNISPLSCSVSVTSHLKKIQDPDPNSDEYSSAVSFPVVSSMSRIPTCIGWCHEFIVHNLANHFSRQKRGNVACDDNPITSHFLPSETDTWICLTKLKSNNRTRT